jgi:Mycoplasma protein of unknown function, DUF285
MTRYPLKWTVLVLSLLVSPAASQTRGSRATVAIEEPGDSTNMVEYWDDPKCFETTEELRAAVEQYKGQNTYDQILAKKYGWPMNHWCVSNIEDFSQLFHAPHHRYLDEPLEGWDMSSATDLSGMFQNCHWFNQPLNRWDVSAVRTMTRMFAAARNFNQPLDQWNVERVQDMSYMFLHAFSFNQPQSMNGWNIGNVKNLEGMFRDARSLDDSLLKWDVSHVDNTKHMVSSIAGVSLNLRGQNPVLMD